MFNYGFQRMKKNLSAKFWNDRYLSSDTPWEQDHPSPIVKMALEQSKIAHPVGVEDRCLIPGCGFGQEARLMLELGWQHVDAIDISELAIQKTKEHLGEDIQSKIDFILNDLFEYQPEQNYHLIVERAMLCALDPSMWQKYLHKVSSLLNTKGFYCGGFYVRDDIDRPKEEREGPPFPILQKELVEMAKAANLECLNLQDAKQDSGPERYWACFIKACP